MEQVCAPGYSLGLVCGVGVAAWLSGALFGWSLRRAQALVGSTPAGARKKTRGASDARSAPLMRSRRSGYYFSEESREWGDGRWRPLAGWALLILIIAGLTGSLIVATLAYKSDPSPIASAGQP